MQSSEVTKKEVKSDSSIQINLVIINHYCGISSLCQFSGTISKTPVFNGQFNTNVVKRCTVHSGSVPNFDFFQKRNNESKL